MLRNSSNDKTCYSTCKPVAICLVLVLGALAAPSFSQVGHVHELYYNNSSWVDTDLTALTGGGTPSIYADLAAFYTTPNQQLHVYYVNGSSGDVHQLYFNGTSWSDGDLTSLTGGPQAVFKGITGFATGNLQHVFYQSADLHVHQLYYNNSNWSDQDITAAASGPQAAAGPMLAFATFASKPANFHVYYQSTSDLHLHQLYFNGTSWSDQDLTGPANEPLCYSDYLAGFASGNTQHVFCPGYGTFSSNLDMLHIYYNNSTWVYEDITYKSGGAELPQNLGGPVAAFRIPATTTTPSQFEAYGVTTDTHVHQYTHLNGKWTDLDLTGSSCAPYDSTFAGAVAFPTTPNNQSHFYFQPDPDVYQLYFNGSGWSCENLTFGLGKATQYGGMAGFAIGNLQHVYYVANP